MVSTLNPDLVLRSKFLPHRIYKENWLSIPQRRNNVFDNFLPIRKVRSAMYTLERYTWFKSSFTKFLQTHPDWVIFCNLNPECCINLKAAKKLGIPCAGIAYGSEVNPIRVRNTAWLRNTLDQLDLVITISEYTRGLIIGLGIHPDKVVILHPGLVGDFDSIPAPKIRIQPPNIHTISITTVARLIERKGVQTLIKALDILRVKDVSAKLHIIGDGPYRQQLEELCLILKLDDNVIFHGSISDELRQKILNQSDIFSLTPFVTSDGDVEGFGIVFLEAGFAGKPVIGSRSGGVPDAVINNQTGFLIPSEDETTLAESLYRLASDPILRSEMGLAGQRWAIEHLPITLGKQFENFLANANIT